MENLNNENNTPNYNSDIYNEPVPQPEMFNSGASYGQNNNSAQQTYEQPQQAYQQTYQQPQQQYQQQYQQTYQQPQQYQPVAPASDKEEPISLGEWIGTILLTCIPCVNIVLLFVWAFSANEPKSKSNWAKANLIFIAIVIVLEIILASAFVSLLAGAFSSFGSLYDMLY